MPDTSTPRAVDRRSKFRDSPVKARFGLGVLAMFIWFILAINGVTPVQPLVDVLRDIVLGTIFYHAVMTNPKG